MDTSGEHRFSRARPIVPKPNSVVNASLLGAACPQLKVPVAGSPVYSNVTDISEDCPTLIICLSWFGYMGVGVVNVDSNRRLTLISVTTGGESVGQIYDKAYNPAGLVLNAKKNGTPIIYAAMNYRLNMFGFADLPSLRQEGSLNSALHGQRLALEWIQHNIMHFGGEPNQVAIFGESDGGRRHC
ncbi:Alpha/Beta hydrolase protein [Lipomyces doorenjongii]